MGSATTRTIRINLIEGDKLSTKTQDLLNVLSKGSLPLKISLDDSSLTDIKSKLTTALNSAGSSAKIIDAAAIKTEISAVKTEMESLSKSALDVGKNLTFNFNVGGISAAITEIEEFGAKASAVFAGMQTEIANLAKSMQSMSGIAGSGFHVPSPPAYTGTAPSPTSPHLAPASAPPPTSAPAPASAAVSIEPPAVSRLRHRAAQITAQIKAGEAVIANLASTPYVVDGMNVTGFTPEQLKSGSAARIVNANTRFGVPVSDVVENAPSASATIPPSAALRSVRDVITKTESAKLKSQNIENQMSTALVAHAARQAEKRAKENAAAAKAANAHEDKLAEEFQSGMPFGEYAMRFFGRDSAANAARQKRADALQQAHGGLVTSGLQNKLFTKVVSGPGEVEKREAFSPSLIQMENFKDPAVLAQVAFGGVFGGAAGLTTAALGAATPLKAGGALLIGAVQQAVFSVVVDPILNAMRSKENEFKAAGEAYSQSILGITSVLQQSSRVLGAGGTPLGKGAIGAQLQFQEQRAIEIQKSARSLLLPQGIGGATEATFVQGVVSAMNQRGFANESPERIAKIASILAGVIRAQRPQLLENPALLNRDLQDVLSGLPQAQRTILGSLIRGALPTMANARSGGDVLKSLMPYEGFSTAVSESMNIRAVQARLEGARELNSTLGGEAYFGAIKPGLVGLKGVLEDKETRRAQEIMGESLGRIAKVGLSVEVAFTKLGASAANMLSPFVGMIDAVPKFTFAMISATMALNSTRLSSFAGKLGLPSAAVGTLGTGLGLGFAVNTAIETATALTELNTERLQNKDSKDEEHVNRMQALAVEVNPEMRAEQHLRNAGALESVDEYSSSQSRSSANQIRILQSEMSNLNKDKRGGAYNELRTLIDTRSEEVGKLFGGGLGGELGDTQHQLIELTSDARRRAGAGIINEAQRKLSEVLTSKDNLSESDIAAKAGQDAKAAREAIENQKYKRAILNAESKSESAAPSLSIDAGFAGDASAAGTTSSAFGTSPREDITDAIGVTFEEQAKAQSSLAAANEKINHVNAGTTQYGLAEIANLSAEEHKILQDKEKEVQYSQTIAELMFKSADALKSAFITSTPTGARLHAEAQSTILNEAVNKTVESRVKIDSKLDELESHIEHQAMQLGSAKTDEQRSALRSDIDLTNELIGTELSKRKLAGYDIAKGEIGKLEAELAGKNAGDNGGVDIVSLQDKLKSFNPNTLPGQSEQAKTELQITQGQIANAQVMLSVAQSRLGAPSTTDEQKSVLNQFSEYLKQIIAPGEIKSQEQQFQIGVVKPFNTESTNLQLQKALLDSGNLILDENDKRRSLNDQLTTSTNSLAEFDAKVRTQTMGSENSLAALGQKIKAEGGIIPASMDYSPERMKQATLAEDVAEFNRRMIEHGSTVGGAVGGRPLGFTNNDSPFMQAQEAAKHQLEQSIHKITESVNGLDNEFRTLSLTLQNTIDTLSHKLGIPSTKMAEKPVSLSDPGTKLMKPGDHYESKDDIERWSKDHLPKPPAQNKRAFTIDGKEIPGWADSRSSQSHEMPPSLLDTHPMVMSKPLPDGMTYGGVRNAGVDKIIAESSAKEAELKEHLQAIAATLRNMASKTLSVKVENSSDVGKAVGDRIW